jgi:carbon-monoxide dehydrogenase large subunit
VRLRSVYTNTVPVDAYRGAGRPEASYLIERAVDAVAHDLDIAPDVIRRRNLIKPKALPYKTPTGKVYDSGDFAGTLARAQELADWDGFNKRAAQSRRAGRLRGIGIATYVEACGNNGPETATLTLDRDGGVTLRSGSAFRRSACAWCRATPTASKAAPAPAARARFRSAACPSTAPPRRWASSSRPLRPMRWKRA